MCCSLFGAEDVDLRTLPPEETVKEAVMETPSPAPAPDLAAVRAKLAEATRRDPLGRPLLFTGQFRYNNKYNNSETL